MGSETTKRQIGRIDELVDTSIDCSVGKHGRFFSLCQAKLALVQCLAEQERMEQPTPYQEKLCRCFEDLESMVATAKSEIAADWGKLPTKRPDGSAGGGK